VREGWPIEDDYSRRAHGMFADSCCLSNLQKNGFDQLDHLSLWAVGSFEIGTSQIGGLAPPLRMKTSGERREPFAWTDRSRERSKRGSVGRFQERLSTTQAQDYTPPVWETDRGLILRASKLIFEGSDVARPTWIYIRVKPSYFNERKNGGGLTPCTGSPKAVGWGVGLSSLFRFKFSFLNRFRVRSINTLFR